jgi:RNA polymerase sigma factor (sigma-70 family)
MQKKTDIELVELVKSENNNDALKELINRHANIFYNVCASFCRSSKNFKYADIIKDVHLVIYHTAKSFNKDHFKKAKFSTFLCHYSRYFCLNTMKNRTKFSCFSSSNSETRLNYEEHEILDVLNNKYGNFENPENTDYVKYIFDILGRQKDKRLVKIFRMRFFPEYPGENTLKSIGNKFNFTSEQIRLMLNKTNKILKICLKREEVF